MEACLQVQILSVYPKTPQKVEATWLDSFLYLSPSHAQFFTHRSHSEEAVKLNYNQLLEGNKNIGNH